jgi:hypothetical protein
MYLSGDSVGIEYETDIPASGYNALPYPMGNVWRETEDGSILTDYSGFDNSGILINSMDEKSKKLFGSLKTITTGVEYVSNYFEFTNAAEIETHLNFLMEHLRSLGEPPTSERSGIHFHISMPVNLQILKSIIKIASHMEDIFYYIGCFGYEHRGNKNDLIYCRPITAYGPVVLRMGDGENGQQVFTCESLLKSESVQRFWKNYCGVNYREGVKDHWHPVRYHWINLLSLVQKGSLEFRLFNKTLNTDYIMAALEFCVKFSNYILALSFAGSYDLSIFTENSIYADRDKESILKTFYIFSDKISLSQKSRDILEEIIKISPKVNVDKVYCLSHREAYTSPFKFDSEHKFIPLTEVKKPNYVDIHLLRGNRQPAPPFEPVFQVHNPQGPVVVEMDMANREREIVGQFVEGLENLNNAMRRE